MNMEQWRNDTDRGIRHNATLTGHSVTAVITANKDKDNA